MRRLWISLVVATVPLLLAIGVALLVQRQWLPNFLFRGTLTFDLPGLALRLGGLLTGLGILVVLLWRGSALRIQQAILQAENRQLDTRRDFLRRLDHELKNPLTILHLGVTNLRQSPDLATEQYASLERMRQQIQRLQKLVVDLRWLTELDAGALEQAPVNLQDVLNEAILLARNGARFEDRLITLTLQRTPWPLSDIPGDRELLVIAFRNLIENAFKYTASDDQVEVRGTENGQMAVIEVADTGFGIAAEEQDLIFENLYRSQDARAIPGSGLGLPLVQQIVQLHGGQIRVRSRPQAGTVFTVQLPLTTSERR